MKNDYRTFKLSLLTLAPIHIGNEEKYTSREFIYENKKFYFPDMGKFYNKMVEKRLAEKFEAFLIQTRPNARNNRLISFLNDNRIAERSFGGYSISETGLESDRNPNSAGAINEVNKFIRDAFGNPYIPGSSLKGAIRTILMNTTPKWNNENAVKFKKENKKLIPWGPKKGEKYDDLFNAIRVSDSKPFDNKSLILVQKWDYSAKTNKAKPLPLYRESISPLTKIEFDITTTTDEAGRLIEDLGKRAQAFYKAYKAFFLSEFPDDMIQTNLQYPIYLGAGTGAWTKTLFKQADGILQNSRMTTKMVKKGVLKLTKAPLKTVKIPSGDHSLIKNHESFYEMGKANFLIKEMDK